MVEGAVGMDVTEAQWRPATGAEVAAFMGEKVYKDALTGQTLPPALVEEARKRELEYFASKGVRHLRPREEAYRVMGKAPISVKWVDTNKQDDENPLIRSRLVAREIRLPGQDSIFAPTRGAPHGTQCGHNGVAGLAQA